MSLSQVWFQNRRAKFRRNERNMLAQRNALYGGASAGRPVLEPCSLEQPIAARPSPVGSDYLSWSATAAYSPMPPPPPPPPPQSQYSPMGGHPVMSSSPNSPVNTSSSCALAGNGSYAMASQAMVAAGGGGGHNGLGIGSSIASLRLKAQEYNMQQTRYPIQHQMAQ